MAMVIGDAYGEFFCYPYQVTAKEMGIVGHVVNGRRLAPGDNVWLAATSLPMGHSWLLCFCQRLIELRAAATPELAGCTLMRDRGPSTLLRPGGSAAAKEGAASGADVRHVLRVYDPMAGAHYYIYVDNLGVLSRSKEDAKSKLDGVIRMLESFGMVVPETEISSGKIETLGVELDCDELVTRVTRAR